MALIGHALPLSTQSTISGKVVSASDQAPIPFATVYFDGTTVGTTTDEAGTYQLSLAGISLPATLVVTHLNFTTATRAVREAGEQPGWSLAPAVNEFAAVEVGDRNHRVENLKEFREALLGTDEWGRTAELEQTDRLIFDRTYAVDTMRNADVLIERYGLPDDLRAAEWSPDGKSLTFERAADLRVRGTGPLSVDVPALGYRISAGSLRFTSDYAAGSRVSMATYYFQPYEGASGRPKKKHARNRRRAYYASSQHFLRALYHDRLDEEGYAVFETVNGDPVPLDLQKHLRPGEYGTKVFTGLTGKKVAIIYYHDRRGAPFPPERRRRARYVTSYLFVSGEETAFRSDGTVGAVSPAFGGPMGLQPVTRLLPSDYTPAD